LVLLLLDYYAGRKISRKMILEKIPFFIISLIFGIVAIYSQKSSGAIQDMAPSMTFIEHVATICFSFITYLFKAFIPVGLSAYYTYPAELGSTLPFIYYLSIFIVVLILIFVWYSRKWGKDMVFGFLFFVVTIILVLQIIPIGATSMAERYTYLPYIGLFFIIGKLYETLSIHFKTRKNLKNYLLIFLALCFIAFSVIANERIKKWKNEEILFSDVISKHPDVGIAYLNRGNYYYSYYANQLFVNDNFKRKTYIEKAARDFENTLKCELSKDNKVKAYFNLGTAKKDLGDYAGAIKNLDSAIKIDHTYYSAYNNRGAAKYMVKDYQGAIYDWNKAIELNPHLTEAISNRDTLMMIMQNSKKE
jgi:protein O-mannosyl-transferase